MAPAPPLRRRPLGHVEPCKFSDPFCVACQNELFRALTTAADPAQARSILQAQGFVVEYVEERWGRRFAAAFLEGVRLIDNVPILEKERL